MKTLKTTILVLAAACSLSAHAQTLTDVSVAEGPFEPNWESLAGWQCPEWFRDAKFGLWAHWGPQCQAEDGDWYARHMYFPGQGQYNYHVSHFGDPSVYGLKELIRDWKAEQWNPDELIQLYASAGAKYFMTLGNHHDNFDLWDSPYQEWNSVNLGPKRDIVGEWAEACEKYGLPLGISIHASHTWTWMEGAQAYDGNLTKADGVGQWWEGYDPQELYAQQHAHSTNWQDVGVIHSQWNWGNGASQPSAAYKQKFQNRVLQCIDKYHPRAIYFDDSVLPFYYCDNQIGYNILAHYYNQSANANGGQQDVVVMGKILNDDQKQRLLWDVERGIPDRCQDLPWQTCTCIGSWHYDRGVYDRNGYKSAATVVRMLVDVVSKNGNLLLSIPVRGNGTIDEKERAVVLDIKAWMDINKESIYGTRPWKTFGEGPLAEAVNPLNAQGFNEGFNYTAADVRYNAKGSTVYATIMQWPTAGDFTFKAFGITAASYSGKVNSVKLLGYGDVAFTHNADGLTVNVPATHPNPIAPVFEITFDDEASTYDQLQELITAIEAQLSMIEPTSGVNTGKYSAEAYATLQQQVNAAKAVTSTATDADIEAAVNTLRTAYQTYVEEGFCEGGALSSDEGTDLTTDKLVEASGFCRTDGSTSRFGTPMYWTVENFSVPQKNTANGTKNGIDNYTGASSLMLGVWKGEDGTTSSDLANARLYRRVTLPAGQYFFGGTYNQLNAVNDQAYIFASTSLTTTSQLPDASLAYYALNKCIANDGKYYGIQFTLDATTSVCLGWQIDLTQGSNTQEFRVDQVKLLKQDTSGPKDVTTRYLTNPDFEGSYVKHSEQPASDRAIYKPEGWTVDWNKNSDDLSCLTTADLFSNLVTGSFTMIDSTTRGDKTYWARLSYKRISTPKFRILQTVNLQPGRYRLTADMLQYNADAGNKAYLFAGSTTTACPTSSTKSDAAGWNNLSVEFTVNEAAAVELGFSISHTVSGKEQIVGVDNFKLELLESFEGNVSYTSRMVNPNFEYTAEGVAWTSTWRGDPWGWTRSGELTGNSYGISNDGVGYDGKALCWYRSVPMPDSFQMSQTVEGLPVGHYVVSCKMMNNASMVSNQRLFANRYSCYFGSKSMYGKNIDASEIASFQGHTPTSGDKQLEDLTLDILLYEGQALTLGVKSGNMLSDGSRSTTGAGWFKADDFRISYRGYDAQEFIDFLRLHVVEGQALVQKNMDSAVRTALETALTQAMTVDASSENTALQAATDQLLDALVAARASVDEKAGHRDLHLVMDMVHHNPGEAQYDSQYNNPATLAAMGYNAKCFYLFDSPTLAIDWDDYDPQVLPAGSAERQWVETKAARLNTLYDECEANNIDVYAMCDLVLLPKRLVSLKGIGSTFGNPLDATTQEILRYQMTQCFEQFPQLDGLVVRIGETYLQDAPYHQGSIQNKTSAQNCIIPLMQLLREVVCEDLNKKIIFRTWMSFDEDLSLYNQVSSSVEPHENLYLGVKHCEGDFHRGDPFSKVLGQGQHQQVVEVQCAREYEGKGAFPNYVARGVIDGFEEDAARRDAGLNWCLRDVYESGLLSGVWTWTRGGGWEGPYIKDELWCDLNAWVMAQWALHPEQSEEQIFSDYCTTRLGLDAANAEIFRNIALKSEHAVLRGLRSAEHPDDIYNMWVRDEYITFPTMPDAAKTAVVLQERDEAVADWQDILQLSEQFSSSDEHLNEVVKVTCAYGYYMFRIFRDVSYAAAIHQSKATGNVKKYVEDYNTAWFQLEQLAQAHATTCPTLYNRTKVMRTSKTVADQMMKSLGQTKVNFAADYGLQQRDITVKYLVEARNFARTDEMVGGRYKRYGSLKHWTVENLGIDMGSDGINNGADAYNGMCEINMDQWYNGFVGSDSKVYRHITLPAGRYAFNAYATSCYGMDDGTTYMFVAKTLPTTSTVTTLADCQYINMAVNAHTGWWGIEFTLDEPSDIYLGWCADFKTGNYELRVSDVQLVRAVDPDNGLPAYDDEALSTTTADLYIPVSQWADKGTFQGYKTSCQYDGSDPTQCRLGDWKDRAAVVGDVDFGEGKYDVAYFYIQYDGASLYGNSGTSNLTASNSIDLWLDNITLIDGDPASVVLNGQHIATLPGTAIGRVMTTYEVFEVQLPEGIQGVHTVSYKNNGYSPLIRGIGFKDSTPDEDPTEIEIAMNRYGVMSYCSPYDLDFTGRTDDLRCYVVSGFTPSENAITLTRADHVQGGTGIVLLGAEGDYTVPVQETDMWWSNLLVGVTEPTQVDATTGSYTNFILGVLPDETVNWSISAGGILDGGKAYLQLPTDSSAPLRWIFDDGEDGIEDVENEGLKVGKDDAVYDLQGRLVGRLASGVGRIQKGIYIVDGKKVLVR